MSVYLDHNATCPVYREVVEAMLPYFRDACANASSTHAAGRGARRAVEAARERVAALVGAAPQAVFFTSGGTEANNLAILGAAAARTDGAHRVVASAVEHHSVLHAAAALAEDGWDVAAAPVAADGRVDIAALARILEGGAAVVSVMAANNETGVIQPCASVAAMARARGATVHCDAVQAAGKIPVDVARLDCDLLSLSAHKLHGPQGAGALYVRPGTPLRPLLHGGAQEDGLRPGTYNLPGIVGFGKAAELARRGLAEDAAYQEALRDRLEAAVCAAFRDAVVFGAAAARLPNTSCIGFHGRANRTLAAELDMRGIHVATGSACASGSGEPSHVLAAMGVPAGLAGGALRFSVGPDTTEQDIDATVAALKDLLRARPAAGRKEG